MKKVVEIQLSDYNLREAFMSWFEDEGAQHFEDWVLNYTVSNSVEFDFSEAESFIIIVEDE